MTTDMLGQEIKVGSIICYYNFLYIVKSLGKSYVKAKLKDPSPTTSNKTIYTRQCIVIDKLLD